MSMSVVKYSNMYHIIITNIQPTACHIYVKAITLDPQTGLHKQTLNIHCRHTTERCGVCVQTVEPELALEKQLCFIEWTYWLDRRHKDRILGRLIKDINMYFSPAKYQIYQPLAGGRYLFWTHAQ